jgi:hypothetical protein
MTKNENLFYLFLTAINIKTQTVRKRYTFLENHLMEDFYYVAGCEISIQLLLRRTLQLPIRYSTILATKTQRPPSNTKNSSASLRLSPFVAIHNETYFPLHRRSHLW